MPKTNLDPPISGSAVYGAEGIQEAWRRIDGNCRWALARLARRRPQIPRRKGRVVPRMPEAPDSAYRGGASCL